VLAAGPLTCCSVTPESSHLNHRRTAVIVPGNRSYQLPVWAGQVRRLFLRQHGDPFPATSTHACVKKGNDWLPNVTLVHLSTTGTKQDIGNRQLCTLLFGRYPVRTPVTIPNVMTVIFHDFPDECSETTLFDGMIQLYLQTP
jgi:hypothetical protein